MGINYSEQLNSGSPEAFYMHLGRADVEYIFSSMKIAKQASSFIDLVESLGLPHSQNFIDSVISKVNPSFYISQDMNRGIYMVGKYTDLTYITSSTLKELISEGYDLNFDGILIIITRNTEETKKEQIESLKALGDKYPLGFSRFK